MILIDTSVLVAYLCPEPLHAAARRALSTTSVRILTPMVRLEAASALGIKTRSGDLSIESAQVVLGELDRRIDQGDFVMRDVEMTHYRLAYDWLSRFKTPLRTVDAIHLAGAAELGAKLVTADQMLARSAKLLGVACQLIH